MIYSKDFVFIHNPKAAGTSFRNALMSSHQVTAFWGPHYSRELQLWIDKAHIQVSQYHAFPELADLISNVFTFGVVRNPYDRFASAVRYFNQKNNTDHTPEYFAQTLTEAIVRFDRRFIHFCPQHYFFFRPGGKSIADQILKSEAIDLSMFKRQTGAVLDLPSVKANTTKEQKLKDNGWRDFVLNFYVEDFEAFQYER